MKIFKNKLFSKSAVLVVIFNTLTLIPVSANQHALKSDLLSEDFPIIIEVEKENSVNLNDVEFSPDVQISEPTLNFLQTSISDSKTVVDDVKIKEFYQKLNSFKDIGSFKNYLTESGLLTEVEIEQITKSAKGLVNSVVNTKVAKEYAKTILNLQN